MPNATPVKIALIGAGSRGELNLGYLAKRHPGRLRFVAVAERDEARRKSFVENFGIPPRQAFADWEECFAHPKVADAVIIALPCHLHYRSARAALQAGYHVLLEKPMSHSPGECVHLQKLAEQSGQVLMIALQCRYNRIYSEVMRHLQAGRIGRLMNIDCGENIGYWHFIMSYVRGMHSRSPESHSFLLAKGIHDIDLINWFASARATRVSSMGRLSFFCPSNAPEGAPKRCTDGCPVQRDCEFDAVKQYLNPGRPSIPLPLFSGMSLQAVRDYLREPRFRSLASTISHDIRPETILKALRESPHGRCVFACDNDVVDHQTVSIEYENEVTVSFSLSGFSLLWERTCNFHGTQGEIRSADFSGRLELREYNPARIEKRRIRYHGLFHGGGDEALLLAFSDAICQKNTKESLTSAANTVESHLLVMAAEEARRSNSVIDMDVFRRQAEADAEKMS